MSKNREFESAQQRRFVASRKVLRYLIIDRDILFAPQFKGVVEGIGIDIILTAYRAPNMNAHAERFVRSIKSECLAQMIFVGQASLDHAVSEFVEHYHDERPHQGLANKLIRGRSAGEGVVDMNERLGGLLKYYHRRAA